MDLADDFADIDEPQLHQRTYLVRAFRHSATAMRLRGVVHDLKPAGLYLAEDPEPMTVHHMILDLIIDYPSLVITDAKAVLETHPHPECVRIEDHYLNLIGLSIARGFTHKVRELFGGPRGCTHTTMLLQAMAPVAVQSMWSMQSFAEGGGLKVSSPRRMDDPERQAAWRFNLGSCHVWAEDGDMVALVQAGGEVPVPVWAEDRLRALGRDPNEWRRREE